MEWEEFASHAPTDLDKEPINERRSISSHTPTKHGVYDDGPLAVEGLAYYWYQRAVYWKREAHRNEGVQQTMNFDRPTTGVDSATGMCNADLQITRNHIKAGQFITAIKHVHKVTGWGLVESKNLCDNMREEMGWNGMSGANEHFSNP